MRKGTVRLSCSFKSGAFLTDTEFLVIYSYPSWYKERDILTNGDFRFEYKLPLQKDEFYSDLRTPPESAFSQK